VNVAGNDALGIDARQQPGTYAGGILRYLMVAGLALFAFVVLIEPEVGFVAPPAVRLLFWALQIAAGLLVLQSILYVLTRLLGASRMPTWALVLLSAILGAAVLAPVYWLIGEGLVEGLLGYPRLHDLGSVDFQGPLVVRALVEEYVDIVGPVTAAWALVCLPRLNRLVPPLLHPAEPAPVIAPRRASLPSGAVDAEPHGQVSDPAPRVSDVPPFDAAGVQRTAAPERVEPVAGGAPDLADIARLKWSQRLPSELGNDVIAVASELQYLRVWTPRGCALVLGALADVESESGSQGLRVHRSWWIACRHVVSVRRTASGAVCVMSDGRQVPVSRRRRAEVLARFGDGAQYVAPPSSETVANADLH
jgi:hypothetical protein